MSKSKKGNKDKSGADGSVTPAVSGIRKTHVKRSFVERLVGKGENVFAMISEIARNAEKRGVPNGVVQVMKEFVELAVKYREAIFDLRNSGWAPADKSVKIDLKEGAKVQIDPKFKDQYDYILGLQQQLVVSKVISAGKRTQYLVMAENGTPCGYVPKSHLLPR